MPAGIFQRHVLDTVTAQPAAGQRQTLAEACADEQVLRIGRCAADAAEVIGEPLTQLRDAARVGVADGVQWRLPPGAAQRAQPAIAWEAREVRKPGTEVVGELRQQRRCGRPGCARANAGGDANGRALPRLQVALGGQLVIGRRDHATRHAELGSELAARGQRYAGL